MRDAEWIVGVIMDVAAYAEVNGLPKTFNSLTEAMIVASLELNTNPRKKKTITPSNIRSLSTNNVFVLHNEKLK